MATKFFHDHFTLLYKEEKELIYYYLFTVLLPFFRPSSESERYTCERKMMETNDGNVNYLKFSNKRTT